MPLKVIVSSLLVVAGLMTAPLAVGAADRSTPEQAKALAEKAATYLKDKGPDAALPDGQREAWGGPQAPGNE